MVPTNVCDAHEPPRSSYYGREIDQTTARRPVSAMDAFVKRFGRYGGGAQSPLVDQAAVGAPHGTYQRM